MTAATRMARRELHAATSRSATSLSAAQQMLMPYRHNKMAAVSKGFEFKPGFIYTAVRAISARINQNYDGWPSQELKKSYRTFIGKPVFVNHQNFDPSKARGKVIAARYVEAGDDKYVETVMEIDAQRFPKLAHEIKTGGMDSVSMGVEAGFTICSYCGNKAVDTPEFCAHVKYHKGERLPRLNERTGAKEDVLVYEKCYKLGFFELSYVFDPADETAVVSRVIAAAAEDEPPPDEMIEGEMPSPMMPQARRRWAADPTSGTPGIPMGDADTMSGQQAHGVGNIPLPGASQLPTPGVQGVGGAPSDMTNPLVRGLNQSQPGAAPVTASRYYLGYGEIEAPEDVDTLRNEEDGPDDGTDDFKHYVESPKELRGPDLDQTKQLDRDQEQQGLDTNRRVEQVEDIGGIPMAARRNSRRRQQPGVLVDPRTGRRYYAADDEDQSDAPPPDFGGGDPGGPPPPGDDAGPPPPPPGDGDADDFGGPPDGDGDDGSPHKSDEELIQEAEDDLQHADQMATDDFSDLPGSDAGGTQDDYSDADTDFGGGPDADHDEDGSSLHGGGDEDLPPWLQDAHDADGAHDDPADLPLPPPHQARRNGNQRGSYQNKRRGGSPMSLAKRGHVATAGRRRHYADDNGYTDGGPYHTDDNDQGEKEDTFITQTPGAEAVAVPTPGDGTISNTENNLVARINRRNAEQKRDLIAYEQITGRRLRSADGWSDHDEHEVIPNAGQLQTGPPEGYVPTPAHLSRRRRQAEAVESPDKVDPTVNSGSGAEEETGNDFQSLDLDDVETQPKDASRHAFNAFDRWLYQATGRTARQHGNVRYIQRQAARWCKQAGISPNALFPTMGFVLREAQRSEGATRRAAMKRRADESLEVAAPQDRIDVEAPVRDTTDAEAQASQFDLGDFGDNAGDNLADPELSPDTQIWAPGEGDASVRKDSNRKTDGITAVRYAEAYIRAGLGDNTSEEKWKIAGLAMTMRHGTIVDRISVLDAVNSVNDRRFAALKRQANVNRASAPRGLPQGLGQRQLSAGTQREASANDDSAIFLK